MDERAFWSVLHPRGEDYTLGARTCHDDAFQLTLADQH